MFAERFKYLRESNDISQKDMAKIFNVGPSTISMWEQDKRTPDKEMLVKIADHFNVSIDYLLGRTDNSYSIKDFDHLFEFTINDDVRRNLPLDQVIKISNINQSPQKTLELVSLAEKLNYNTDPKDDTVLAIQLGRANKKLSLNVEQIKSLLNYLDKIGFDVERTIENSSGMNSDN